MPVHFCPVPPDQFLALAPGLAVRPRAGAIIYDAAIARPGEAPAVAEIISRLARVRFVHAIATERHRSKSSATRSRSVSFQFRETIHLRTVMRIAVAIDDRRQCHRFSPESAFGDSQDRVPAVDLGEHRFHLRIAEFIFRIPPIERAQRFVERIV